MTKIAAFRADASVALGAGHVARCLALAGGLADRGWRCVFIIRDVPGHMAAVIQAQGHSVTLLQNGADVVKAFADIDPAVVVIDHYELDGLWHVKLRTALTACILAIDDLANRPLDCDLLLDQNLGRSESDYDALVAPATERLIGPRCAHLRPEFASSRARSLKGRKAGQLNRVLFSMGGSDPWNATGAVLTVLEGLDCLRGTHVVILLGAAAPHVDTVRAHMADMPFGAEIHVATDRMAELMVSADFCIGAAGSTSWERCCLGVPGIVTVLADNQQNIAAALHDAGAAVSVGWPGEPGFRKRLGEAIVALMDAQKRQEMSAKAAALVDGAGVARVCDAIERSLIA